MGRSQKAVAIKNNSTTEDDDYSDSQSYQSEYDSEYDSGSGSNEYSDDNYESESSHEPIKPTKSTKQVAKPTKQIAKPTKQVANPTKQVAKPTKHVTKQVTKPTKQVAKPTKTGKMSNQSETNSSASNDNGEVKPKPVALCDKTKEHLKNKIDDWLDCDDKIKLLNTKLKQIKDEKKAQEDFIIKVITKLGMDDQKIDIHDKDKQLRSRVYKHKSVTKGAYKENIIKDALMEAIRDEKKVDNLLKKIDSKRPLNERTYLKRTKGTKED